MKVFWAIFYSLQDTSRGWRRKREDQERKAQPWRDRNKSNRDQNQSKSFLILPITTLFWHLTQKIPVSQGKNQTRTHNGRRNSTPNPNSSLTPTDIPTHKNPTTNRFTPPNHKPAHPNSNDLISAHKQHCPNHRHQSTPNPPITMHCQYESASTK